MRNIDDQTPMEVAEEDASFRKALQALIPAGDSGFGRLEARS